MSGNKSEMILSVTELIIKHGVPAALGIIKAWNTEAEPTLEEIRALRNALPDPDTFFDKAETK